MHVRSECQVKAKHAKKGEKKGPDTLNRSGPINATLLDFQSDEDEEEISVLFKLKFFCCYYYYYYVLVFFFYLKRERDNKTLRQALDLLEWFKILSDI